MKNIGGCLYAHKSAIDEFNSYHQVIINKALQHLPDTFFDYEIIKLNTKENYVSFIKSYDWDTVNEPTVGDSCKIDSNSTVKITKGSGKIYHHKWQFVKDNYKGFNVQQSKERSILWESIIPHTKEIKSRIQSRKYWNEILEQYKLPV